MIPAGYIKKNKFLHNWPYQFPDLDNQNEVGDDLELDNFEQMERRSFMEESGSEEDGS